jgi:aminoglycoside phosphotransferase (APT) family kinase protein
MSATAVDEALVACIEQQVLPRLNGGATEVTGLTRALSPATTSYTADVLTVELANGRTLELFLKDYSFSRLPKDDAAGRRTRELHVYRDLLDAARLGTPAFYGSVWDEEQGRFLLVLELVEGAQLRSCGFEHWVRAAGWLGRLQGLYARDPRRFDRSPRLLRHDERYFAGKAPAALRNVEEAAPAAVPRLRTLLAGYDGLVTTMAAEPATFVHGNFRPKNIVLAGPRVCVVDWEVSAVGSPLYDLALIADGFLGEQLERLLDAYCDEAEANGVAVVERARMVRLLDCFCLHRAVKSLSRAVEKGFGDEDVARLLRHGESLKARLDAHDRPRGIAHDGALRRCLEEDVAPRVVGRHARVTAVERRPSRASTSYDTEIVTARLAGGGRLDVFLKDFGRTRLPKEALDHRRERELGVYRELIGDSDVGTARYYGSVWDEDAGRYWLLLELVKGTELRSLGVEHWIPAAGWLGRLQGRFAGSAAVGNPPPFLLRHDAAFFRARGESARRGVERIAPTLAARMEKVLEGYERIIGVMAGQAPTLVHGAYRPANILIDRTNGHVRICPTDWELAAVGSGLHDLAFFCDGFEPPVLDRMWDAYCGELEQAGLRAPDRDELRRVVDCFRVYRVISWLAPAVEKRYSVDDVERLVARGELLLPLVT